MVSGTLLSPEAKAKNKTQKSLLSFLRVKIVNNRINRWKTQYIKWRGVLWRKLMQGQGKGCAQKQRTECSFQYADLDWPHWESDTWVKIRGGEKRSQIHILRESNPEKGNGKCRGPEVRAHWITRRPVGQKQNEAGGEDYGVRAEKWWGRALVARRWRASRTSKGCYSEMGATGGFSAEECHGLTYIKGSLQLLYWD